MTVIIDNARVHTAKVIQKRLKIWQQRGLFIFYLPPYSPQLNIIERLCKEIKQGWLRPCDYVDFDSLRYGVNRVFANIGSTLNLNFKQFNNVNLILSDYLANTKYDNVIFDNDRFGGRGWLEDGANIIPMRRMVV